MALDVSKGTFTAPASTGQQTIAVGFEPKLVLFWYTEKTTLDSLSTHAHIGFGFAVGSATKDQYAVGVSADDGITKNEAKPYFVDDACILQITDTKPASVTLKASLFESFATTGNGFKLNWTTTISGVVINYLAIGGADITNVKTSDYQAGASTGNVAVTGVGFQPDLVIFLSDGKATSFPGTGGKSLSIGAAVSSTQRWSTSMVFKAQPGRSGKAGGYQKTTRCIIAAKGPSSIEAEEDFVSMDTDGFTVNVVTAKKNHLHAYLAIKGSADFSAYLGSETQATTAGAKATTGVGFKPDVLFLVSANEVTPSNGVPDAKMTIGAGDGTNEGSVLALNEDNPSGSTNADDYQTSSKIIVHGTPGATPSKDAEADLDSFDSDGFTMNWTTADASAREFVFLAMKGAVAQVGSPYYFRKMMGG